MRLLLFICTTSHAHCVCVCVHTTHHHHRMIRKAEGAIRNRTSRLTIVVERCTNDHNYSAILRTVEALGVENVYIISPQCINQTLTTSIDDEEEADDVKRAELRSSSGPVVKKATESEKKDRAMHHLYARKATEWVSMVLSTVSSYPIHRFI